jgi:DNA polymerase-3 subunit delta'
MKPEDVIGQSAIQSFLLRLAASNRVPHALLFLGPEGSGKLKMALAFAQLLLCEQPDEKGPCDTCSSCRKTSKWIHPDLHFSFPAIGTNVTSDRFLKEWRQAMAENPYQNVNQWLMRIGAENKQGNINKEECLHIIKKLSLKTFEGRRKVLILWLPEYLGKEGNRLLKLIEEPPEDTHFILVAEQQELILNTILSRCQIVRFNPLQDEAIVEGLMTDLQLARETAEMYAHLSDGNYNQALQLAGEGGNDHANRFLDWMRKCYTGNGVELVKWVDQFAGLGRENQKHFLQYGLHFFREYMILKATGRADVRLRENERATASRLTGVIELDQLEPIVQLFNDCTFYVERNANPKVLFLDASIQMNRILRKKVQAMA